MYASWDGMELADLDLVFTDDNNEEYNGQRRSSSGATHGPWHSLFGRWLHYRKIDSRPLCAALS